MIPVWIATPLAFIAYAWLPGFALARRLPADPDDDSAFRLFALPVALSSIVATGITILTALAGLSVGFAAWAPVGLALVSLLVPRRKSTTRTSSTDSVVLSIALGTAFCVAGLYIINPWLGWRADGRFHIGVVGEILRGGLPPNDPFFTGLDLQYMWFFHAGMAGLKSISGASTPALLAIMNVITAAALVILVARVSAGFGHGRNAARIAALFVVLGMGGFGWIFLPLRLIGAFTGDVRGWEAVKGLLELNPPGIATAMRPFTLWLDQPFLLRKFLVGTAMSQALVVFVLHLEMSRRVLLGGGWGVLTVSLLAAAGTVVLHPMMGVPAVAGVCGAAVLILLINQRLKEPVAFSNVARLLIASVLGVALTLPYLLLVTHGKQGAAGLPVSILPAKILSLLAGSIGVLIPALFWMRDVFRNRTRSGPSSISRDDAIALLWCATLVLFVFFFRFPLEAENIDKPTLLVHLALAFPAGWAVARWLDSKHRRSAIVFLVLTLVPLNGLMIYGYAVEPDPRTYRAHEKEAFRFLDTRTDPRSIVFDSQDRDRPAVEIQRRQYWSHEQFAATHEYPTPEMNARRDLRDHLYRASGPSMEDIAKLRTLGAPVYLIVRAGAAVPGAGFPPGRGSTNGSFAAGDVDPLVASAEFERVFDSDDVRVYRLR